MSDLNQLLIVMLATIASCGTISIPLFRLVFEIGRLSGARQAMEVRGHASAEPVSREDMIRRAPPHPLDKVSR